MDINLLFSQVFKRPELLKTIKTHYLLDSDVFSVDADKMKLHFYVS